MAKNVANEIFSYENKVVYLQWYKIISNYTYLNYVIHSTKIQRRWKIQSELTPRANVSLTPENFLILTP